jgi:hypothetical protein
MNATSLIHPMKLIALFATVLVFLAGCETRSISDSGYQGVRSMFRGELSEFDVLGIERAGGISEQEIAAALDNAKHVQIRKGSSILLIQSGADFPDEPMVDELGKYYTITPFSGQPDRIQKLDSNSTEASYAKSLRLAAARGGNETILCYWGILESAREGLASKPVSWVPIVGWVVPDEKQHMRIRIKAAILNVRTGDWSIYRGEPIEQKALSGVYNRESSDQRQVLDLKRKAYAAAAGDLVKFYSN